MIKVIQWLIFQVVLSLTPVGAAILSKLTINGFSEPIDLNEILKNGELILVTAAIVGAAIGDLLGGNRKHPGLELISGGGCIVILLLTCLYFPTISNASANLDSIKQVSFCLFGTGFVASLSCIVLSGL